jgi:hypothetical protein
MKTLQRLFTENPSYLKRGVESLIKITGLAESTIVRFRKSGTYKDMKTNYKNKLASN